VFDSFRKVHLVAQNTFNGIIRDKIFYGVFGFATLFLMASVFLGTISLGNDLKIIKDLGLAGIYLFGLVLAIYFGTALIDKEILDRTYHLVILRPVSRFQFILGKYLGLMQGLLLSVLSMNLIYIVVIYANSRTIDYSSLISSLYLVFELAVIAALALLFSVFTAPLSGTVYLVLVVYIGHNLSLLKKTAEKSGPFVHGIFNGIYYTFPNFEKFNIKNSIVYNIRPSLTETALIILYSVALSAIFLYLANLALRRYED
jgi:ABC-type transport system involved in multi-copper enzyme maturation permease subunit